MGCTSYKYKGQIFKNKKALEKYLSNTLFQGDVTAPKGAFDTMNNIIYALTNPDITTFPHELAHRWHKIVTGDNKNTNLTDAEIQTVLDWYNTKPGVVKVDEWTRDVSEAFADGFVVYLSEGNKVKNKDINGIFNKFAKWLADILNQLKASLGLELNQGMRDIYARMLNSENVSKEVKDSITDSVKYTVEQLNDNDERTKVLSKILKDDIKLAEVMSILNTIDNNIARRLKISMEEYRKNNLIYYNKERHTTDEQLKIFNQLFMSGRSTIANKQKDLKVLEQPPNTDFKNQFTKNPKIASLQLNPDNIEHKWLVNFFNSTELGRTMLNSISVNKNTVKTEEILKRISEEIDVMFEEAKTTNKYYIRDLSDAYIENKIKEAQAESNSENIDLWTFAKKDKDAFIKKVADEQKTVLTSIFAYYKSATEYPVAMKYIILDNIVHKEFYYDKDTKKFGKPSKRDSSTASMFEQPLSLFMNKVIDTAALSNTNIFESYYWEHATYEGSKIDVALYKDNVYSKTDNGTWYKFSNETPGDNIRFFNMSALSAIEKGAWCTGGTQETADSYLEQGDMYIFYDDAYNNPTLQLHIADKKVIEIGGTLQGQGVRADSIIDVERFKEANPDINFKSISDYIKYSKITKKWILNNKDASSLTKEEKKTLYYAKKYYKDRTTNLEDFKNSLNKQDCIDIFDVAPEDEQYIYSAAEFTPDKWSEKAIVIGNFTSSDEVITNQIARIITGYVDLSSVQRATTKLFDFVGELVILPNLETATTKLFDFAGGGVNLSNLQTATTKLFDSTGGDVSLRSLETATTKLFDSARDVSLRSLKTATTKLFDSVNGYINLPKLQTATTKLFDSVGGAVNLFRLQTATTKLFDSAGGSVYLSGLQTATTKLFDSAKGDIYAPSLETVTTKLFDFAGGNVNLNSLKTATIKLFDSAKGDVNLDKLHTATTKLFDSAGGLVDLASLHTATTKLFDFANGNVNLPSLETATTKLFDFANGNVNLPSLYTATTKLFDSAKNVQLLNLRRATTKLFDSTRTVDLSNLETATTKLFDSADGNVYLNSLRTATTKLFDFAGGNVYLNKLHTATANGATYNSEKINNLTAILNKINESIQNILNNSTETTEELKQLSSRAVELHDEITKVYKTTLKINPDVVGVKDIELYGKELNQDERGRIILADKNKSLTSFNEKSDITTIIHEKAHEYERVLTKKEIKILEKWSGLKFGTTDFSEYFAIGAEKALYEGKIKSANAEVNSIFVNFVKWFKEIIEKAMSYFDNINDFNKDVLKIYNTMFSEPVVENKKVTTDITNLLDDGDVVNVSTPKGDFQFKKLVGEGTVVLTEMSSNNLTEDELEDIYNKIGEKLKANDIVLKTLTLNDSNISIWKRLENDGKAYQIDGHYEFGELVLAPQGLLTNEEQSFIQSIQDNIQDLQGVYVDAINDLLLKKDFIGVIQFFDSKINTRKDILKSVKHGALSSILYARYNIRAASPKNKTNSIFNKYFKNTQDGKYIVEDEQNNEIGIVYKDEASGMWYDSSNTELGGNVEDVHKILKDKFDNSSYSESQPRYVSFTRHINGEKKTIVGKVISDDGFLLEVEYNGTVTDVLSSAAKNSTFEEYSNFDIEEKIKDKKEKYKAGDVVSFGSTGLPFTIDSVSLIDDKIFYKTTEGTVLPESGINGLYVEPTTSEEKKFLNIAKAQAKDKARLIVAKRIANSFNRIFPSIKYNIGYFNFNAPGRFNKGVVEINIGYGERIATGKGHFRKITDTIPLDTLAHEYMHPFVEALKISNVGLYNNLVKDLLSTKLDILSEVDALIDEGTYSEDSRIDEALVLYLGREITKSFNEDGTINKEYLKTIEKSFFAKFLDWLKDLIDVIIGRNKAKTKEEFVKSFNEYDDDILTDIKDIVTSGTIAIEKVKSGKDAKVQKTDENGNVTFETIENYTEKKVTIATYPKLKDLYTRTKNSKRFKANLAKEYRALDEQYDDAADRFGKKYDISGKDLFDLISLIDSDSQQHFKLHIASNENESVSFKEVGGVTVVTIDESVLGDMSSPQALLSFSNKIADNKKRQIFEKYINETFFKPADDNIGWGRRKVKLSSVHPLMSLKDLADYISIQLDEDTATLEEFDYSPEELNAAEQLVAYHNLTKDSVDKIRENISRKIAYLQNVGIKHLQNNILINESKVLKNIEFLYKSEDVDFVTAYLDQASHAINLAWRNFNLLKQELAEPNLTKPKLARLHKELEVIKQLMQVYDDFSSIYKANADLFTNSELRFVKSIASLEYIRNSMSHVATTLATEWLMPYIDTHNKFLMQEGVTDPKYIMTREKIYNNLKYGVDKDTNFITFNLGNNLESRDPVNAAFANIVNTELSANTINIENDVTLLNIEFDKFLKANNIGVTSSKDQQEYYKKHFLRKATVTVEEYDETTNKYSKKKIQKWALHQKYFFDKYDEDLQVILDKYKNPTSSKEEDEYNEKILAWKKSKNFGESSEYLNPDYAKLETNTYFKKLEALYNENNKKYGYHALKFGIIPQNYEQKVLENLRNAIDDVKAGKTAKNTFEIVRNKTKLYFAGRSPINFDVSLDGTVMNTLKTNLAELKNDDKISLDLNTIMGSFVAEATNYSTLQSLQYNAENLKSIVADRTIGQENKRAAVQDPIKMAKYVTRFKELEEIKANGGVYDKDEYDSVKAFIDKGIKPRSYFDFISRRLKPSGTTRLNDMLIAQIDDIFYGRSSESEYAGKVNLNKIARALSVYTSINNMAFNVPAGIGNVAIGNMQLLIEGHGNKYYNKKDVAWAMKDYAANTVEYMKDLNRPVKSKDTQLSFILDAIQGEVADEFGRKVTGNIAKRMFNVGSLFLLTALGEHQIQMTGMKAMLKGKKVKVKGTGEMISLYDAYIADKDGRYSLRTDIEFSKEELDRFIRQLHGVNRALNGNYSDINKAYLQRKWYGTLALKFRKYLYSSFRTRWASEHQDFEKNVVEIGYLRFLFKDYLYEGLKNLIINKDGSLLNIKNLKPHERYAFRKAVMEVGAFLGITMLAMLMYGGSGDDKKEISDTEKYILFLMLRLRSDLGMYHYEALGEGLRQLKSPTASLNTIVALQKTILQLGSPFETYKVASGGHEIGDNMLWGKARKLIPIYSKFIVPIDDKLGYFDLINRNIEGVSVKQSMP